LDIIVKNASEISTIIDNIAVASKEQSLEISQVSDGIIQISRVIQSNSAVSEETAAATQELNSQAERMKQFISYFTLK
jgi:methyl-accepting chemotaxis protein